MNMQRYNRFTFMATLLTVALGVLAPGGGNAARAAPFASCDLRLRVELTPDVPNPRDPGFISSLLGNHPDYRLTLLRRKPEDAFLIYFDLTGPGLAAGCREVVNSMRKDSRVLSVDVQQDAARAAPTVSNTKAPDTKAASTGQPMGTVQAGPDGGWVLKRSSGTSYAQQARIRYQCDIGAVEHTGFDPTEDHGGVPLDEVTRKRADYLRTEAGCFEAHGYLMK
jgi:hypothetical protein